MLLFLLLFSNAVLADELCLAPGGWQEYNSVSPNYSYLANTKVETNDFTITALGGPKKVAELRQQYDDQMRDYYAHANYGSDDLGSAMMRYNQASAANQVVYNAAYTTVRQTQSAPYIQNLRDANNRGDISQPVQYTAGAVGVLSGNDVKTTVSGVSFTTNTNLGNQNGSVKMDANYFGMKMNVSMVITPTVQNASAKVESTIIGTLSGTVTPTAPTDPATAQAANQEIYQLSYSRAVPFTGFNFGTSYAGSTQVYRVFISRQIWKQLSGEIDNSWGNPNINILPETVCKINYGIHF